MHDLFVFAGGFFIGLVVVVAIHTLKQIQNKNWLPYKEYND